jgi:hypothetical protein
MSGVACVRYVLLDTCPCSRLNNGTPNHLGRDGHIGTPAVYQSGEQVSPGLHPSPVLSQNLREFRIEEDIAVPVRFSLANAYYHAFAVDVGHLQLAHLRTAQPCCIQGHKHGAVHQVLGRCDKMLDFVRAENSRQNPWPPRKWNLVVEIGALQRLHIEEAPCRRPYPDVWAKSLRSRYRYA